MHELGERWEILRGARFPAGLAGMVINGADLVQLDVAIAMLIQACLRHGKMSRGGADRLAGLIDELAHALPTLPAYGRAYFQELHAMAELAIRLRSDF